MSCRRADDGRDGCPALVLVYFRLKWAGRSIEEKMGAACFTSGADSYDFNFLQHIAYEIEFKKENENGNDKEVVESGRDPCRQDDRPDGDRHDRRIGRVVGRQLDRGRFHVDTGGRAEPADQRGRTAGSEGLVIG